MCESAVGVMGVPPLLCLSFSGFSYPIHSASVSASYFSSYFLPLAAFPFVFSACCHLLAAHPCDVTASRGSDVPCQRSGELDFSGN